MQINKQHYSRLRTGILSGIAISFINTASFADTITHSVSHTFSINDVQGGFDGSTVGDAGIFPVPSILCDAPISGSPDCPLDGAQSMTDKDGIELFPIDSEFGFNVVDFLGAQGKERDSIYNEGWVGDIVDNGVQMGLKVSNAATDFYKVKPPLGTWCAGLGGNAVKCSTEHYTVMEHVLSCHEVIPYSFADPFTGDQRELSFPDLSATFNCDLAELDDELYILEDGVPGPRLTDVMPGLQMEANDNTTVLNDIAVSTDYSVTLKDDGKPLYRWGGLIKRPNDVRLYARMDLPQEWKENPTTPYPVSKARLFIDHWITNNPNDQLRPEDMENEGATGRIPSYRIENQGSPDEVWKSTKPCFEGDGDFIDIEGAGTPTPIATGTFFKNGPFAVTSGDNPSPFSSDLTGAFTNAWYTTIDRDPFEWSYRVDSNDPNLYEFVGSAFSNDTLGELVSGPRWRLKANKYGQDIPGLEVMKEPPAGSTLGCLPPPPAKEDIKYAVGTPTTTEINLLDFEDLNEDGTANDSPLLTSLGWIDPAGNGINIAAAPGLSVNGLPLTEDFDLAVYIKGDRKPTAIFNARLEIEYEGEGGGVIGTGVMGDYVWDDLNRDGIQDSNEPGLAGVSVELLSCPSGAVVATESTNASGIFSFTQVPVGEFQMRYLLPQDYAFTQESVGHWSTDSNANPVTGLTACVTMADGQVRKALDAGMVSTGTGGGTAAMGDYVWSDDDGDGIQDSNEPGLSGVTVTLWSCVPGTVPGGNISVVETLSTEANGHFLFDQLAAGYYQMEFALQSGYTDFSPVGAGNDYRVDSNVNKTNNYGFSPCLYLSDGQQRLAVDAGMVP